MNPPPCRIRLRVALLLLVCAAVPALWFGSALAQGADPFAPATPVAPEREPAQAPEPDADAPPDPPAPEPAAPPDAAGGTDGADDPEGAAPPADDDWEAAARAAIAELQSDEFRVREAATLKLWEIGERAEPLIREAAQSDVTEVRTRAQRMLNLFRFGIYPDTPPQVIQIINQFRHGDLNDRTRALQQLYNLGHLSTVTKLLRSVDDQNTRRRLVGSVVDGLDDKLAEMFAAEQFDDIEELLKLAAISDDGMRNLAGFYRFRGQLEAKLADLKGRADELSPVELEQLSWFQRAAGDLAGALATAERAAVPELVRDIKIAQGDLQTLIRASHNPAERTIQSYGFQAAALRLGGDAEGFEKMVETIKEYAADNPEEESACLQALLVNGRVDDALEIARDDGDHKLQMLADNGRNLEALALLGVEAERPPFDAWLAKTEANFAAAETPSEFSAAIANFYPLCRFLVLWGEKDEAQRIAGRIAAVVRESDPDKLTQIVANAGALGLYEIAEKYARATIEYEMAEAERGPEELGLEGVELEEERVRQLAGQRSVTDRIPGALFYDRAAAANFWWGYFADRYPDDSDLDRFEKLTALMAPIPDGADSRPEAIALLDELLDDAAPAEDAEDRGELLSNSADIYLANGNTERAIELYRDGIAALPSPQERIYPALRLAGVLGEAGRWGDAASYYEMAALAAPGNPPLVVLRALALERDGKPELAEPLLQRARLQALGNPADHARIATAFSQFGEHERARDASEFALNLATFDDSTTLHREASRLGDYLLHSDDARAAAYKERYLLEFLKGHVNPGRSIGLSALSSVRAVADLARARVALDAGRPDEAVALVEALVASQPANTSILEDLYPELVLAGRRDDADRLYQALNSHGERAVAQFPRSASDLNSLAWLKARCGKDLQRALELSERSNELRADSPAYTDTLAEVHFQLGDRAKAIELSERAVELSSDDYLLHTQLQRFRFAKPLSELLPQ